MKEIEAKFLINKASEFPLIVETLQADGLSCEEVGIFEIFDQYFDTADWQFFRSGWAYRWQTLPEGYRLSLKSLNRNNSAVQIREETEQSVEALPSRPGEIPAGPVAARLGTLNGEAEPVELFRVGKRRQLFIVKSDEETEVELAFDRAVITTNHSLGENAPGRMKFYEVELELKTGNPADIERLARILEGRLELLPARLSKFERGIQAVGLKPSAGTDAVAEQPLRPSDPLARLAYRVLRDELEALKKTEDAAWEGLDPEGVHQMRVAVRRAREGMRVFKKVLSPRAVAAFRKELSWLGKALGTVRDLDVYLGNFDRYIAMLHTIDPSELEAYRNQLIIDRQKERKALLSALKSRRYRRFMNRFESFVNRGPAQRQLRPVASPKVAAECSKTVLRSLRKVQMRGRNIGKNAPANSFHELRILCKRLRYACEFNLLASEGKGKKILKKLAKRLKKLQDVLGAHQDACVAVSRVLQFAERVPIRRNGRGLLMAMGQLLSSQDMHAEKQRAKFREVWDAFDEKSLRKKVKSDLKFQAERIQEDRGINSTAEEKSEPNVA